MVAIPRHIPDESTGVRLRRWAGELQRVLRVAVTPSDRPKTGQVYDIVGTQNLFGEESLFINFGYWQNGPDTLDEASRDLARLIARTGDFNATDTVVDCGCGYGDQDILWVNEFGVSHITGVNLATEQIAISARRVADAGLEDKIDYVNASATHLPQDAESCTVVAALESAFHFPSRVDFFREALRVLKPGGRLVTADMVPKRTPLNVRARNEVARRGWCGASQRAIRGAADLAGYRDMLLEVGFAEAETRPITGDVYRPLGRFLRNRLRDPDMRQVNPILRYWFSPTGFRLFALVSDYIVAVARKGPSG